MKPIFTHSWDMNRAKALTLQKQLASEVVKADLFNDVNFVAGADVAYSKKNNKTIATVVILDVHTLAASEIVSAEANAKFPYVPGLFSFREIPLLIEAFAKLKQSPDLVVCDGQGIAHPRRFGLASHLGIIFDVPTIGCGKTRLIGKHKEPGKARGASAPLIDNNEIIGNVLRTQKNINPVYVSIGHRICLETACNWILKLSPKYRLPETTRIADQKVNQMLKVPN